MPSNVLVARPPRPTAPDAPTLANDLERVRLEHRAARIRLVVAALEDRRRSHDHEGLTPTPLLQALQGFRVELTQAERRLRQLAA